MKLVCIAKEMESEYVNNSYQIKYRISFMTRNDFTYMAYSSDSFVFEDHATYILITQNKELYDKYEMEETYTIEIEN